MTTPTGMYGEPIQVARRIRSFGNEPTVAIIGTGFNTALQLVALTMLIVAERGGPAITPSSSALILAFIVLGGIAGYATLVPWMFAARTRVELAGYEAPATWKIWAGWIIPFYNLVAPFQVMRGLRVRVPNAAGPTLRLWWAGWIVYLVADRAYGTTQSVSPATTSLLVICAIAISVSYAFLVRIIRDVTASFAPSSVPTNPA